jgi:hypothetical protein
MGMTQSNEDQDLTGSSSPWDSAIRERLAAMATSPVDMAVLESRINGQIPNPAQASHMGKRRGCAPAMMFAAGLLLAGLIRETLGRAIATR